MGDAMSDLWERSWLESGVEAAWRDFELRYSGGGTAAAEAAAPMDIVTSRGSSYVGGMDGEGTNPGLNKVSNLIVVALRGDRLSSAAP